MKWLALILLCGCSVTRPVTIAPPMPPPLPKMMERSSAVMLTPTASLYKTLTASWSPGEYAGDVFTLVKSEDLSIPLDNWEPIASTSGTNIVFTTLPGFFAIYCIDPTTQTKIWVTK